jgi:hypothetical protein
MHAPSPAVKYRAPCICASCVIATLLVFPLAPLTIAAKLGGPYYVDDAEIGKPHSCELESWGSFAANSDHILVFSPACVVNLGAPVELGMNLVGFSPDIGNSILSLTAKTVPIPIGRMGFGLAVSGALVYDQVDRTVNGAIFKAVPLACEATFAVSSSTPPC